jgi:hypothetical protein
MNRNDGDEPAPDAVVGLLPLAPLHDQAVAAFATRLAALSAAEATPANREDPKRLVLGFSGEFEAKYVMVGGTMREPFDAAVAILRKRWGQKYGTKSLRERLAMLIIDAREAGEGVALAQFILAADAAMQAEMFDFAVTIPISGLQIPDAGQFDFGNGIVLRQLDAAGFKEVVENPIQQWFDRTAYPEEDKQRGIDEQLTVAEIFRDSLCVTFRSNVDVELTSERVRASAVPVVDFLQYCASQFARPPDIRFVVEYRGDFGNGWFRPFLMVDAAGFSLQNLREDVKIGTFIFNDDAISRLRAVGLLECAGLFAAPQVTEYEDLIRIAIASFAEGERAVSKRQKIVSYVTAIEVFFNEKAGDIVRDIAESVAFLIGKNVTQRREIISRIKDLYQMRSDAAHVATEPSEVWEERFIVMRLLGELVGRRRDFRTRTDLKKWVSQRRLSVPGDEPEPPNAYLPSERY